MATPMCAVAKASRKINDVVSHLLQSVSNETLNELDIHNVDVLDSTATDLHQLARQLYRAGTQEQRFPDLPAGVAELVKSGVAELGWVWCTALKPLPWPSLRTAKACSSPRLNHFETCANGDLVYAFDPYGHALVKLRAASQANTLMWSPWVHGINHGAKVHGAFGIGRSQGKRNTTAFGRRLQKRPTILLRWQALVQQLERSRIVPWCVSPVQEELWFSPMAISADASHCVTFGARASGDYLLPAADGPPTVQHHVHVPTTVNGLPDVWVTFQLTVDNDEVVATKHRELYNNVAVTVSLPTHQRGVRGVVRMSVMAGGRREHYVVMVDRRVAKWATAHGACLEPTAEPCTVHGTTSLTQPPVRAVGGAPVAAESLGAAATSLTQPPVRAVGRAPVAAESPSAAATSLTQPPVRAVGGAESPSAAATSLTQPPVRAVGRAPVAAEAPSAAATSLTQPPVGAVGGAPPVAAESPSAAESLLGTPPTSGDHVLSPHTGRHAPRAASHGASPAAAPLEAPDPPGTMSSSSGDFHGAARTAGAAGAAAWRLDTDSDSDASSDDELMNGPPRAPPELAKPVTHSTRDSGRAVSPSAVGGSSARQAVSLAAAQSPTATQSLVNSLATSVQHGDQVVSTNARGDAPRAANHGASSAELVTTPPAPPNPPGIMTSSSSVSHRDVRTTAAAAAAGALDSDTPSDGEGSSSARHPTPIRPAGLDARGRNNCWFHALVQGLAACSVFVASLHRAPDGQSSAAARRRTRSTTAPAASSSSELHAALIGITRASRGQRADSRLTALRHRLRPSLRASLQHDVHEGLLAILSLVGRTSMHGVYNKTLHFQHAAGQRSTRHRPSCEDVAVEELACLRVYPPQWRNASLRDANEAEAARIRACRGRVPLLEMVQGEMRGSSAVEAKCSKCGDKALCHATTEPTEAPRTLAIHVQRHQTAVTALSDGTSVCTATKILTGVSFPLHADVLGARYTLNAAIIHSGQQSGRGHYYTLAQHGETWFKCDDTDISDGPSATDDSKVVEWMAPYFGGLQDDGTPSFLDSTPSLLLYERRAGSCASAQLHGGNAPPSTTNGATAAGDTSPPVPLAPGTTRQTRKQARLAKLAKVATPVMTRRRSDILQQRGELGGRKRPIDGPIDVPNGGRAEPKRQRRRKGRPPLRFRGTPATGTLAPRLPPRGLPGCQSAAPLLIDTTPDRTRSERLLLSAGVHVLRCPLPQHAAAHAVAAAKIVVCEAVSRVVDNGGGTLRSHRRLQVKMERDGAHLALLRPLVDRVTSALRQHHPVFAERLRLAMIRDAVGRDSVEFHLLHFDVSGRAPRTPRQRLHLDVPLTWRQRAGANALAHMPFFLLVPITGVAGLNVSGRVVSMADDRSRPSENVRVTASRGDVLVCCGDLKHGGAGNTTRQRRLRLHIAVVPRFMGAQLDVSFTRLRDDRAL